MRHSYIEIIVVLIGVTLSYSVLPCPLHKTNDKQLSFADSFLSGVNFNGMKLRRNRREIHSSNGTEDSIKNEENEEQTVTNQNESTHTLTQLVNFRNLISKRIMYQNRALNRQYDFRRPYSAYLLDASRTYGNPNAIYNSNINHYRNYNNGYHYTKYNRDDNYYQRYNYRYRGNYRYGMDYYNNRAPYGNPEGNKYTSGYVNTLQKGTGDRVRGKESHSFVNKGGWFDRTAYLEYKRQYLNSVAANNRQLRGRVYDDNQFRKRDYYKNQRQYWQRDYDNNERVWSQRDYINNQKKWMPRNFDYNSYYPRYWRSRVYDNRNQVDEYSKIKRSKGGGYGDRPDFLGYRGREQVKDYYYDSDNFLQSRKLDSRFTYKPIIPMRENRLNVTHRFIIERLGEKYPEKRLKDPTKNRDFNETKSVNDGIGNEKPSLYRLRLRDVYLKRYEEKETLDYSGDSKMIIQKSNKYVTRIPVLPTDIEKINSHETRIIIGRKPYTKRFMDYYPYLISQYTASTKFNSTTLDDPYLEFESKYKRFPDKNVYNGSKTSYNHLMSHFNDETKNSHISYPNLMSLYSESNKLKTKKRKYKTNVKRVRKTKTLISRKTRRKYSRRKLLKNKRVKRNIKYMNNELDKNIFLEDVNYNFFDNVNNINYKIRKKGIEDLHNCFPGTKVYNIHEQDLLNIINREKRKIKDSNFNDDGYLSSESKNRSNKKVYKISATLTKTRKRRAPRRSLTRRTRGTYRKRKVQGKRIKQKITKAFTLKVKSRRYSKKLYFTKQKIKKFKLQRTFGKRKKAREKIINNKIPVTKNELKRSRITKPTASSSSFFKKKYLKSTSVIFSPTIHNFSKKYKKCTTYRKLDDKIDNHQHFQKKMFTRRLLTNYSTRRKQLKTTFSYFWYHGDDILHDNLRDLGRFDFDNIVVPTPDMRYVYEYDEERGTFVKNKYDGNVIPKNQTLLTAKKRYVGGIFTIRYRQFRPTDEGDIIESLDSQGNVKPTPKFEYWYTFPDKKNYFPSHLYNSSELNAELFNTILRDANETEFFNETEPTLSTLLETTLFYNESINGTTQDPVHLRLRPSEEEWLDDYYERRLKISAEKRKWRRQHVNPRRKYKFDSYEFWQDMLTSAPGNESSFEYTNETTTVRMRISPYLPI